MKPELHTHILQILINGEAEKVARFSVLLTEEEATSKEWETFANEAGKNGFIEREAKIWITKWHQPK